MLPLTGVLEAQLEDIASALAAEYWDDYKKQFLDIVANSFLEEYDELNIEVAFKNAVANSVSYTMYCRFVESPDNYFEHEDFQKVFDFNTRQTVNALGTAVNAISTRMFQEIEKAIGEHEQIKATERSTDYERDDLQTGRRLSDSEPSVGERGRETSGQVRQDASSIFGTEQSDAPERHDSDGEPVPAPVEIEETAKARVEFLMEQYLKDSPAPDKETQQMAWVQHMNSLKAQAEEVVMTELINS